MTEPAAERWSRISALLDAGLELPPTEWGRFLDGACAGDPALRAEAEALLAASARGGVLDLPASAFAAGLLGGEPDPAELAEGARVGPYRVVRELGRGGMGVIYLAERDDPQLRQRVAIKRMHRGLGSDYMVRRFVEERQILASLDHPGIARLVDGAVSPDGVPWFAMEYVEGVPIDRHCDDRRLTVEERLELFCQVCDTVRYAHRNLVVHQDLKPSNILVDASGRPRLLDFGIARMLSDGAGGAAGAPPLLTPAYASPEQLRGEGVSTAADVYALGVLLHRLLSGAQPAGRARGARVPPSAALLPGDEAERVAAARRTTPARLHRRLRGDLDAIVLRAAHPEPSERYATVEHLAAELRRHLAGFAVDARPGGRRHRLLKFVGRNRRAVAASAAAGALLVALTINSVVQARRAAAERDRAQQVESFVLDLLQRSDLYQGSGRAASVRELLDRGAAQLASGELRQPEVRWRLYFALGRAYYSMGEYAPATAHLDSSYAIVRRLRGAEHPETVSIANQLADVLRVDGRYERAHRLYAVILAARRRAFGDGSTEVARSLNGLAMVLRMEGRHREAEALLREALATDRRHAAGDPAALAQTLNNLGHVLREQGRLAASEALHRESLATRRAHWGPEHFEVSVSLANLAGLRRDQGDWAGADTLYRQVLELRERLVGDGHPDLATDRAGYARLLHLRGEPEAAEALYRRALAVHRRVLPAGHLVTASTLLGLGNLLVDRGRPPEAEPLLEEALRSRRARLAAGHPLVQEAERALEPCLNSGRHTDSEEPVCKRGRE